LWVIAGGVVLGAMVASVISGLVVWGLMRGPSLPDLPPAPIGSDGASDGVLPSQPDGIEAMELMVRQGEYQEAVSGCLEILELDPQRAGAYRVLGMAYSRLGAKAQACESYRRYIRLAPQASDRSNVENIISLCD
jgi:tetratricopeptide (TPR) repeat protein